MNAFEKQKRHMVCKTGRGGFTLIEVMVVIVVISILAGLLFPALKSVQKKTEDTRTKTLCQQTATAWNLSALEHRRFPSKEVLKWNNPKAEMHMTGGDQVWQMNNRAVSVLNWWKPRAPENDKDRSLFEKWLTSMDNGDKKFIYAEVFGGNEDPWYKKPSNSDLNDMLLERSPEQQQWGLICPWAIKLLKDIDWVNADNTERANVKQILDAATVRVILDQNGTGKVTLPDELGGGDVYKSAVAFAKSGPEKNAKWITSW